MKKARLFLLSLIGLLVVSGCRKGYRESRLTDTLVLCTITDGADSLPLLGVKEKTDASDTGRYVVPPAPYLSVRADSSVITCTLGKQRIDAFTRNGKRIGNGSFELFTKLPTGCVYLGTDYRNRTYYFPKTGQIINTVDAIQGAELLFLMSDAGGCHILTYDGDWVGHAGGRFLLIKQSAKDYLIAVPDTKKNGGCTLYDYSEKIRKRLTPADWQKLEQSLKNRRPFGPAEYAEAVL